MGVWEYRFPRDRAHQYQDSVEVIKHLAGEVVEAAYDAGCIDQAAIQSDQMDGIGYVELGCARDCAEELMDVIHVTESALHRLEDAYPLDLDEIVDAVIEKNRRRGYYL